MSGYRLIELETEPGTRGQGEMPALPRSGSQTGRSFLLDQKAHGAN